MPTISIEAWAQKNGVPLRKAYRWASEGKLPTATRKVMVRGVPSSITVEDVVKNKPGRKR